MAWFGSSTPEGSAPSTPATGSVKLQIQEQVAQELAVANATELVNNITQNCFDKCIGQPGASLSSADEGCLTQCMEKYMRSWNVISKTYIARIQANKGN